MKKTSYKLALLFLTISLPLTAFLNLYPQTQAQTSPSIIIEPRQTTKLALGETFTINVTVENCVDVYAVQVEMDYDPNILNAISILEGDFLSSGGETFVVKNESIVFEADPPYAKIVFVATLLGDVPGASGSGFLFNVTFEVIGDGSSLIRFIEYFHDPTKPGAVEEGTYFLTHDIKRIFPELHHAFYGTPISFSADPSRVKVGGNVTLGGQVLGVEEALNITIHYRKHGGNWSALVPLLETNATGHFSYVWTTSEVGVFGFKVSTILEEVLVESGVATVTVESEIDLMTYIYIGVIAAVIIVIILLIYKRRMGKKPEENP